jgi:hypothetical protein
MDEHCVPQADLPERITKAFWDASGVAQVEMRPANGTNQ